MTRGRRWSLADALLACLLVVPLPAQTPSPSDEFNASTQHLIGIRGKMRISLEELPNYTCRMETRRAHLGAKAREKLEKKIEKLEQRAEGASWMSREEVEAANIDIPLDALDIVALEVAFIDSKELYAFPGSRRFEERSLAGMIGHGTVATGAYAGHARTLFINGAAVFTYIGEEVIQGQRVRRYDYTVDASSSGFSITNQGETAVVPYHGSFWASIDTDELRRLIVRGNDIPYRVGVDEFETRVDYQTLELDQKPFIVPQRSRLTMSLSNSVESVNETEYMNCRSFVTSSELSFDDSSARFFAESVEEVEDVELPVGLSLPVRLTTAIDSETARVGTPIQAELTKDVRYDGNSVVPKGALLSGRLRRFEFYDGLNAHHVVGIEFVDLSFDAGRKRAPLYVALEHVVAQSVQRAGPSPAVKIQIRQGIGELPDVRRTTIETYRGREMPGVGSFFVTGKAFRLKPGVLMTWKTIARADVSGE